MKRMVRLVLVILWSAWFTSTKIGAQNQPLKKFDLSGQIQTEGGMATDVVVYLLRAQDSSLVKMEMADEAGRFVFKGMDEGHYLLRLQGLTYQSMMSGVIALRTDTTLPAFQLKQKEHLLREVTVTHQKLYIERGQGMTILNVESSLAATGSTAFEILEKAPGVVISNSDNITLRGKQGIMVQIDGKNLPMSGQDLGNYLRGIPSGSIEKIELITNPSAKYDAAGAAIINIKLKKDKRLGTNGSISLAFGQGVYPKTNDGISLNHRNKRLNVFGNYNYAYREAFSDLTLDRSFYEGSEFLGAYQQHNRFFFPFSNHIGRIGMDFYKNDKNTFGILFNGLSNRYNMQGANNTDVLGGDHKLQSYFQTDNAARNHWFNYAANLNYKHIFDSLGAEISVDFDAARYGNNTLQNFDTRYLDLNRTEIRQPYLLEGDIHGKLNIYVLKADYAKPFSSKTKIETGLKTSIVRADNNLIFKDISNPEAIYDSTKSNHFIYDENINAAYGILHHHFHPKWNMQLGLRLENTRIVGNQLVYHTKFDTSYTQLFPTVTVGFKPGNRHSFEWSINRRIDRPGYQQLNPFKFYLDPTTYKEGNPYLVPQTTHSLDFNYVYNEKISLTLSYFRTVNNITETIGPSRTEEKVTVQTERNIDFAEYYSGYLSVPGKIGKFWVMQNDFNFYYGSYTANILNTRLDRIGNFTWNINSVHTFTLTPAISAELSGNYRAPERYAFDFIQKRWSVNMGIQKKLWEGRANIKFSFNDLFYTNQTIAEVMFSNYTERFTVRRETRVATLAFTCRFGNNSVTGARRRSGGADDLKRRAASGNG